MLVINQTNTSIVSSIISLSLCLSVLFIMTAQNTTGLVSVDVGVVLNLDTDFSKMGLSCINMALSDFYASHASYKTRVVLYTRNSKQDVVEAASAAQDLINNVKVQAILGPVTSMQASFVIQLGKKAQVPIISFTATDPSLTSLGSSYFFRIAQNDSYQVLAIRSIVKAFGWRQVVPIYVENNFGDGPIPYLTDALQEEDARIPYRSMIPPSASDDLILAELYKLMTMQTRVFVVHMNMDLASKLFAKAEEIGMMSKGYVWIVTDSIANELNILDALVFKSMQGVLGVKTHVERSANLDDFTVRWKRKFQQENPNHNQDLSVSGIWGYDAAWALAMAVENVGNLSDLNGQKIGDELSTTQFRGLSGEFKLVNRQLQSPIFEIVNVHGNGGVGVGFWTPKTGLTKVLNSTVTSSLTKGNLSSIIWPGDSTSVPKGWEIPTNGKKLRIGVPVKHGFTEFIKVTNNSDTGLVEATGFVIDVFNEVLAALPYALPHEFIPFDIKPGDSTGTYNDLLYRIFLGEFDAVVGDTTIIANRSLYVDFTLPYTESGVSMVVQMKDNWREKKWAFLKPLTWDLWLASGFIFILIGVIVWFLEHQENKHFQGELHDQISTTLWFGFSIMVFAQKEEVVTKLARVVLVVWFFVVLVLTQSYTASLSSLLTIEQLQPTITDFDQLLNSKEHVGYKRGSFIYHILKSLKFDDSRLVVYSTPEEMDDLFKKGTAKGGFAAAFDEIPYLKLSLSKYCPKYSMRPPQFKTDGFGFAFPIGSPLVSDMSRAILNVTQGEKMTQIENKWFEKHDGCPPSRLQVNSTSLSLDSFLYLFLFAGIFSVLAVFIFIALFIRKKRADLRQIIDSANTSKFEKIKKILKVYYKVPEDDSNCDDLKAKSEVFASARDVLETDDDEEGPPNSSLPSPSNDASREATSGIEQAIELTARDNQ